MPVRAVRRSVENSLTFGLFADEHVGEVVEGGGYLADVLVLEPFRE
jgi:hypothetical protein